MTPPIILASGSAIRRAILDGAAIQYSVIKPNVDETIIKEAGERSGLPLMEIAEQLADAKALDVSVDDNALVIGSDQILSFEGKGFDKPPTMEAARARLKLLEGKTHQLINAVSVAENKRIVWRSLDTVELKMRSLTNDDVEQYLDEAGAEILSSVGAYQLEKLGSRLFESVKGDYFTVLGMSLFPLLGFLRSRNAIKY
ncbi:MAG: Maf family protein [Pseudomonadota bacterium]